MTADAPACTIVSALGHVVRVVGPGCPDVATLEEVAEHLIAEYPPAAAPARLEPHPLSDASGAAGWETAEGRVPAGALYITGAGLPAPEPGRLLVVSMAVAAAARDRLDLVVPGGVVRSPSGEVVACRRLDRVVQLHG